MRAQNRAIFPQNFIRSFGRLLVGFVEAIKKAPFFISRRQKGRLCPIHHPAGAFLGCSGLFCCLRGGLHNERSERNHAAPLRSLSCQASGSNSSATHCWPTTISSQKTKMPSDTMMTPGTACSSSTRRERTVSLLTHRGTTTPGIPPSPPTPAAPPAAMSRATPSRRTIPEQSAGSH